MNTREIRRKDRTLDDEGQLTLLKNGEYGFLAMKGTDGYGYGIPISFVYTGNKIYFHCAPEGYKLKNLAADNRVSFCVVGKTDVVPGKFTTAYESVMAFGKIETNLSDEEKYRGLELLAQKYSPDYTDVARQYIKRSFHRTLVLRLDIEALTGKSKIIHS